MKRIVRINRIGQRLTVTLANTVARLYKKKATDANAFLILSGPVRRGAETGRTAPRDGAASRLSGPAERPYQADFFGAALRTGAAFFTAGLAAARTACLAVPVFATADASACGRTLP